jgi:hypothetical protein
MAGVSRSELPRRAALGVVDTWRRLNFEQRVAAVGSVLLIVSTFGPFSFVEGAIVLIALSVLLLLRKRARGREFHVPFGDGTIIAAAGVWSAVLILIRLFDRPLGQGLLALACSAMLFVAGLSERRKRLPDDLPEDAPAHQRTAEAMAPLAEWEDIQADPTEVRERPRKRSRAPTRRVDASRVADPREAATEPLPPPEYRPPGRAPRSD